MSTCQCGSPGYCQARGVEVTTMGHRICSSGDERAIRSYFKSPSLRGAVPRRTELAPTSGPVNCAYLGGPVKGPDGKTATRDCPTCKGTVRLKLSECHHPGHAADPTTTDKACRKCPDYSTRREEVEPEIVRVGGDPVLDYWRGGA